MQFSKTVLLYYNYFAEENTNSRHEGYSDSIVNAVSQRRSQLDFIVSAQKRLNARHHQSFNVM